MIVISGALALVAFVLLIAGLVQSGLGLVYASIAVSLVSAVFLGVGAYQRRGEEVGGPTAEAAPESASDDEVTRVVPVAPVAPADASGSAFADVGGDDVSASTASGASDTVLVVPGRPRYHVTGCRYLVGKDGEERSLGEARNEGYTACGICRPDENLGVSSLEPASIGAGDDDDEVPTTARSAARTTSGSVSGTRRGSTTRSTSGRSAAKKTATTKKAATSGASTTRKTAAKKSSTSATKKTAAKKSSTSATKKTAAKKSSTSATKKTATKKTAAKKTTRR